MWFCDISKCLIGEETRRTRIDGFIISQFFSRTIICAYFARGHQESRVPRRTMHDSPLN